MTLKNVDPTFLAQGGARGIVPLHVLKGQDLKTSDFNKKPVGSGPYKLVSYTPGQSVVLEAVLTSTVARPTSRPSSIRF